MSIYTTPYTYLVKHKPTGRVYYGVRFARGCHPTDLWESYFTSSKYVQELIEQDGPESFECEIRRTFKRRRDARNWEAKVLKRLRVVDKDHWLNKSDVESIYYEIHPQLGKPLTEERKANISKAKKGKKIAPCSPERATKISKTLKAYKRTPEHEAALTRSKLGNKRGPMSEAHKQAIRDGWAKRNGR